MTRWFVDRDTTPTAAVVVDAAIGCWAAGAGCWIEVWCGGVGWIGVGMGRCWIGGVVWITDGGGAAGAVPIDEGFDNLMHKIAIKQSVIWQIEEDKIENQPI